MNPLANLRSPFGRTVVADAWTTPPPVDVDSIHKAAFVECERAFANASDGNPDSVLIFGPAGAGKTHLLTRLQRHLGAPSSAAPDRVLRCVFVSAKLKAHAPSLWQFLRRLLADDLMRQEQGLTQLQRLVAHQLADLNGDSLRHWAMTLRVLTKTDDDSVSGYLADVAQRLRLSAALCTVIDHLVHNRYAQHALDWLRGHSLHETALDRLGLSPDEPDNREEAARLIVTELCRLAGHTLPIVFCFDQIEALDGCASVGEAVELFGRVAADLADADDNILLISCIQSAFLDVLNDSVREADRQRIFKRRALLEPLTPEQVRALLLLRLDSVPELRELRKEAGRARFYPFDDAFVAQLASAPLRLPRRVLADAAAEFERIQRGDPPTRAAVQLADPSSMRSVESPQAESEAPKGKSASDKAAGDKPSSDKAPSDKAAKGKPSSDKGASGKAPGGKVAKGDVAAGKEARKTSASVPSSGPSGSDERGEKLERDLENHFAEYREEALKRGTAEASREALLHGLPMLWALRGAPFSGARAVDIDLVLPSLQGGLTSQQPVYLAICNETNLTSLAQRLKRLVDTTAKPTSSLPPQRLVLLRDPRLSISRTATRTRQYLTTLEQRGARVVKPSEEALAALDALRSLLSDARAGDLSSEGETIREDTVGRWLVRALDDALLELCDTLEGRGTSPAEREEAGLLRDLDDILLRDCIASLDVVASELRCDQRKALTVARHHPDRFGVLQGPPTVLFSHVPADALGPAAE
ncbi:ATP-binding protein [Chondromyces crocatus]|uniref:Orc1-like AAA ATPase domain-containing protein n=1 Tax=Chondromyces crocatus TaxID=52 RepID=A0A0K1EPQ3_CHOCO|nr:ATP-binding protein [Chondromyces crocatus]AKT42905.1 uncharacterized protein CMC5_071330 [Chondromyces crocatus]